MTIIQIITLSTWGAVPLSILFFGTIWGVYAAAHDKVAPFHKKPTIYEKSKGKGVGGGWADFIWAAAFISLFWPLIVGAAFFIGGVALIGWLVWKAINTPFERYRLTVRKNAELEEGKQKRLDLENSYIEGRIDIAVFEHNVSALIEEEESKRQLALNLD